MMLVGHKSLGLDRQRGFWLRCFLECEGYRL